MRGTIAVQAAFGQFFRATARATDGIRLMDQASTGVQVAQNMGGAHGAVGDEFKGAMKKFFANHWVKASYPILFVLFFVDRTLGIRISTHVDGVLIATLAGCAIGAFIYFLLSPAWGNLVHLAVMYLSMYLLINKHPSLGYTCFIFIMALVSGAVVGHHYREKLKSRKSTGAGSEEVAHTPDA